MHPVIQLDLFCTPSPEVINRIKESCNETERIRNVVRIGEVIKISPMLINAYTKILLK